MHRLNLIAIAGIVAAVSLVVGMASPAAFETLIAATPMGDNMTSNMVTWAQWATCPAAAKQHQWQGTWQKQEVWLPQVKPILARRGENTRWMTTWAQWAIVFFIMLYLADRFWIFLHPIPNRSGQLFLSIHSLKSDWQTWHLNLVVNLFKYIKKHFCLW